MAFITKLAVNTFIENPAKKQGLTGLIAQLEHSQRELGQKFSTCPQHADNHRIVTHIIGLERWGQNRLRVALGEPFRQEEYDGYRPAKDVAWHDLVAQFQSTRAETLQVARQLSPTQLSVSILHNQWGHLTACGWLQYLYTHAEREAKRIK